MIGKTCFVAQVLPESQNAQQNLGRCAKTPRILAAAALYSTVSRRQSIGVPPLRTAMAAAACNTRNLQPWSSGDRERPPAREAVRSHCYPLPRPAAGPTPAAGIPLRRISARIPGPPTAWCEMHPDRRRSNPCTLNPSALSSSQLCPGTTRRHTNDQATALQLVRWPETATST